MKRLLFLLTALLTLSFICNSFSLLSYDDGEDDDPEEIIVTEQNGQNGPMSMGGTHVQAFKTGETLCVQAWGVSVSIQVTVIGRGGMVQTSAESIGGYAQALLDLSSLASGDYLLLISAPGVFYGYFSK